MKILVISDVPWCDDNSVGNTYSNIFNDLQGAEFANLYCKSGKPSSKLVKKYFQITEKKMLLELIGKRKNEEESLNNTFEVLNRKEQKLYDILRTLRFQSFFLIRELIWKLGRWKTKELNDFLDNYKPDIIFSFCLDSLYYANLVDYCRDYTKAKLVLFFADDVYSYINKNPLYITLKYFTRKTIKKLASSSALLYGATPQLCDEYSIIFNKEITPLYKVCKEINRNKTVVQDPMKITYTGNLFYGRWETLALVAQAIKEINIDTIKVQLDIYTTGIVTKKMDRMLNIQGLSRILGAIPYEQVKQVLKDSDVVLHVESFDKKEVRKTRLSFSTKIVDCMQSGSCMLAVGPEKTASISLLKDYGIAQVVSENSLDKVKTSILRLIEDHSIIIRMVQKMNQVAIENHSINYLKTTLYADLGNLVRED